jgi:prophage regulatory protein
MNTYIIRPTELAQRLGVSHPTLWRMEKRGDLPPRKQIGPRAVGWLTTDIEQWLSGLQDVNGVQK